MKNGTEQNELLQEWIKAGDFHVLQLKRVASPHAFFHEHAHLLERW